VELRIAVPETHVSEHVLNPALETVTRVNERLLREGKVPTFDEALKLGVRWQPEPKGQPESFDHAGVVMSGPRWGARSPVADCDDLAPYAAASMRASGEDPGAKAVVRRSGPGLWHAYVLKSDGSTRDPSEEAGMNAVSGSAIVGVGAAVVPCMFPPCGGVVGGPGPRPSLALRRVITAKGNVGFDARCDIPIVGTTLDDPNGKELHTAEDWAVSTTQRSRTASQAIIGAIAAGHYVATAAGIAKKAHLKRLVAIAGILGGDDPRDLVRVLGRAAVVGALPFASALAGGLSEAEIGAENVGFNFGKFLKTFEPLVSTAVSFIPGVGPIVKEGMDLTTQALTSKMNPADIARGALNLSTQAFGPNAATAMATDVLNTVAPLPGQKVVWTITPAVAPSHFTYVSSNL
jgi:hypothetical protein